MILPKLPQSNDVISPSRHLGQSGRPRTRDQANAEFPEAMNGLLDGLARFAEIESATGSQNKGLAI